MFTWMSNLVDSSVQCWGCSIFDRLFQVISAAAAAMYSRMATFGLIMLLVFIAFYVLYAFWKNIESGGKDSMYQEYIKPVIINSVVVISLLGAGVFFPRMITTVTLEPVADMTLMYTQAMLQKTSEEIEAKVPYTPQPMPEDGFYRPQLRDKIIELIKTSTTQFQAMIKLGLVIMDGAFSWGALYGIGALIKHIIMFAAGLALAWGFIKLFVKFCFYFVDVIVALTFFAFFFPLGLVFFVFKDSKAAQWVKDIGNNIAPGMLKDAINSIVTLATVIITYVVIMVMITKFFAANDTGGPELLKQILSGEIYSGDLSDDNLATMNLAGLIVLMYVVQYLAEQIGEVTKEVTNTFGLEGPKAERGDMLGEQTMTIAGNVWENTKKAGKMIFGKGEGG